MSTVYTVMENGAPTGRNRNGSMFSLSSFLLCTAAVRGWRTFTKRLIADTRVCSNGRSKWARCRRRCYPSVGRSWFRRKNACKLTTDVGLFSKNYTFLNRYFSHQDYNSECSLPITMLGPGIYWTTVRYSLKEPMFSKTQTSGHINFNRLVK